MGQVGGVGQIGGAGMGVGQVGGGGAGGRDSMQLCCRENMPVLGVSYVKTYHVYKEYIPEVVQMLQGLQNLCRPKTLPYLEKVVIQPNKCSHT